MKKEPDWKRVADSYRDDLANLILAGNRLARGEAPAAEWHAAVRAATVAEAPICVLSTGRRERRTMRQPDDMPDQIDMMDEDELRGELRKLLNELGPLRRRAADAESKLNECLDLIADAVANHESGSRCDMDLSRAVVVLARNEPVVERRPIIVAESNNENCAICGKPIKAHREGFFPGCP